MAPKAQQQRIVVERLAAHLLATGLSRTSLRDLAQAAGVSDRMLIYYFTDKETVLAAALAEVAEGMTHQLEQAAPLGARVTPGELTPRLAALTTGPEMRPYLRLWVEAVAAAAKGEQPYLGISSQIMSGFLEWVEARLDVPEGSNARAVATAIVALVDGLALIDICVGPENAAEAVSALPSLATPPGPHH